jgi:TPP-dependent pyruvate/acetoin dehydrogenase alpha subunit
MGINAHRVVYFLNRPDLREGKHSTSDPPDEYRKKAAGALLRGG